MLIVDSGFSFTHVIPIINGQILWKSVRRCVLYEIDRPLTLLNACTRLDVGGKLLTNHLKELVSFRQWNMMDETFIVNDIKEACCYVSNDYKNDMERSRLVQVMIEQPTNASIDYSRRL
jgi:actin-related protein 6